MVKKVAVEDHSSKRSTDNQGKVGGDLQQNTRRNSSRCQVFLKALLRVGCSLIESLNLFLQCNFSYVKSISMYCNHAPVVQRVDTAIHWINCYPVDSVVDSVIQPSNNRCQFFCSERVTHFAFNSCFIMRKTPLLKLQRRPVNKLLIAWSRMC